MFDPIASATVEVTGAAVPPIRHSNASSDEGEINRLINFTTEGFLLVSRVSAIGRKFLISSRGIVTDQAVDAGLRVQIEVAVTPAIIAFMTAVAEITITPAVARVAAGAPAPVSLRRKSEIVDDFGFSETLLLALITLPGPVNCAVHLSYRLGMTGKACFGYLGASFKLLPQHIKFAVIRRRFCRCHRCRYFQGRCAPH